MGKTIAGGARLHSVYPDRVILDRGGKLKHSGPGSLFQIDKLHAGVNWDNPDAFSTPGAPPNGSDYLRLRDAAGTIGVKELGSIQFNGAATHIPALSIDLDYGRRNRTR